MHKALCIILTVVLVIIYYLGEVKIVKFLRKREQTYKLSVKYD